VNVFVQAISNAKPIIGTVPLRKGGSVYRVPGALTMKRRQALAIKWIVAAARKRKGKPMEERLYTEIMDAYNNTVSPAVVGTRLCSLARIIV
jgi:small subunit ribosomal protein S7